MKDFRSLKVWQKSHLLTLEVYKATRKFPREEQFGLTSQIQRAAASIPTNIAEGAGRDSDPELQRFLTISFGSASELDYLLLLAHELGYISPEAYGSLQKELASLKRMLNTFIQKLTANRQ